MGRLVVEGAPGELADFLEAGRNRRHRGGELVELVGEHGLEQGLLVAEVLVEPLLVDPGPFGDAGHGRAVRPVLGELRRGRLLAAPARFPAAPARLPAVPSGSPTTSFSAAWASAPCSWPGPASSARPGTATRPSRSCARPSTTASPTSTPATSTVPWWS